MSVVEQVGNTHLRNTAANMTAYKQPAGLWNNSAGAEAIKNLVLHSKKINAKKGFGKKGGV